MSERPSIFILTFCRREELSYGTELIFKTLRTGFPNSEVTVVDNASLPRMRKELRALAEQSNCSYHQIESPGLEHHEFIRDTIFREGRANSGEKPIVFLDPDLCFWKNCEDFHFSGLIAGRLLSTCDFTPGECVLMPRLHSSFLWIPSASRLCQKIQEIQRVHFDFDPFQPISVKLGDVWLRYDSGASLYSAIQADCSFFTEEHLSCYDHIFCGSHIDIWINRFGGRLKGLMHRIHNDARAGRLDCLKGIWKEIDKAWAESFSVPPESKE